MNNILYLAYLGFFGCLFLANNFFVAFNIFVYLLAPLALVPVEISFPTSGKLVAFPVFRLEPKNLRQTLLPITSRIFIFASSYGAIIVISSTLQPSWSLEWFLNLMYYLISIVLFMLITARLALYFENFYETFIFCLSVLSAVNGLINIHAYFMSLDNIEVFTLIRFTPSFGRVPDHFPTTGAMTYATCLVAASGLSMMRITYIQQIILSLCSIVLFLALIITQSRGPFLGAFLAILILCWSIQSRPEMKTIILPGLGAGLLVILTKIGSMALNRLDNHRLEVWWSFWRLACERIVFGYGERLEFLVEISDGEKLGHAHNILMNALLRGGLFAMLCIILSYVTAIFETFVFAREFRNPIPLGLVSLIIIAGFVDFDHLVFLADWQWVSFWFPLGLSISCEVRLRVSRMNLIQFTKYTS